MSTSRVVVALVLAFTLSLGGCYVAPPSVGIGAPYPYPYYGGVYIGPSVWWGPGFYWRGHHSGHWSGVHHGHR